MKLTRVIAVSVIAGVMSAFTAQAQTLRDASPPAEFPPASFQGKQYVDSRGCIYIRAGIDGNVTWVPRVTRGRKQVCGYQPTLAPGSATASAAKPAQEPVLITVPPEARPGAEQPAQPAATEPTARQKPRPLPAAVAEQTGAETAEPAAKPAAPAQTAQRRPSPGPEPTVFSSTPAPKPAPAPAATAARPRPAAPVRTTQRRPSPGPEPTVFSSTPRRQKPAPVIAPRQASGGCPNASAFSQQYINKGAGVRCGPQAEPPVTYRQGTEPHSALVPVSKPGQAVALSPDTRVVPRHVYDNRRNTNSFTVPKGYRRVWKDDRLNPHRAERTLRPAELRPITAPPPGYVTAARGDDRLNPNRGIRSAAGDAQTDMIWTRTVPRRLVKRPTDRPVVQLPRGTLTATAAPRGSTIRLSTRSAPVVQASAPVTRR